ncbi:OmpA family protein [Defluviimonas sp. WL0002]|uniref:OmpA family protein n=1 Tax=Albidovulum marisflavi TaxID=2984159 RepID=A0ABT2ZDG8_9RHOB|nr:OmpA family protein [Defluviimonas sp. WL0002]MCV2869183.1 OmpA family protein [Defluviimonas sp. WL0002]
MHRNALFVAGIALAVSLAGAPIHAQSADGELTAEEIAELFAKQKTRGLVLAPSTAATTVTDTAAAAATEPAYQPVAAEEQINLSISFDYNSSSLRADQTPKLATMCEVMKSVDVNRFQVIGHTDSSGSEAYNQSLSEARAEAVVQYLVNDCGIAADQLMAVGAGESSPLDAANPGADVNRRVEFQALG